MNNYNIIPYIFRCNVNIKLVTDIISKFNNVMLGSVCIWCSQNGYIRTFNNTRIDITPSYNETIKIVYQLSRSDHYTDSVKDFFKTIEISDGTNIPFIYEYSYQISLDEICNIICRSLGVTDYTVSFENVYIRAIIENLNIRIDEVLAYTMINDSLFIPREKLSRIRHDRAKLVHISSTKTIEISNAIVNSLTLSFFLGVRYGTKCLLVSIKRCSIEEIDTIYSEVLDLLGSLLSSELMFGIGDRLLDYKYLEPKNSFINETKLIRSLAPDVMIDRYSRESPRMVYPIDDADVANTLVSKGYSCIRYPKDGRWYVCTDINMYVGLKLNRLSNKNKFKYIPTVYTRDHALIPNTHTYNYLNDIDEKSNPFYKNNSVKYLKPYSKGLLNVPMKNIMEFQDKYSYFRMGLPRVINDFPGCDIEIEEGYFVLCKQDAKAPIGELYRSWNDKVTWDDISTYRCILEMLLNVNVLVVEYHNGVYKPDINCKNIYLWNKKDLPLILIVKDKKDEYEISYEMICTENGYMISEDTCLYQYFINVYMTSTCRYIEMVEPETQYINSDGLSVLYISNNEIHKCYSPTVLCNYIEIDRLNSVININETDDVCVLHNTYENRRLDNTTIINGMKYYISDCIPTNIVPEVLKDLSDYIVVISSVEQIVDGLVYIIVSGDCYRFYLRL